MADSAISELDMAKRFVITDSMNTAIKQAQCKKVLLNIFSFSILFQIIIFIFAKIPNSSSVVWRILN